MTKNSKLSRNAKTQRLVVDLLPEEWSTLWYIIRDDIPLKVVDFNDYKIKFNALNKLYKALSFNMK